MSAWRVAIDTGGTFTDCRAVDPAGRAREIKVLSSSALRGRIVEVLAPNALRFALDLPCDDFAAGLRAAVLGRGGDQRVVVASRAADGRLHFDGAVDATAGDVLELRSDEPAPILAARLVTATPAGRSLPELAMRLATTRGTNALLQRNGARTALFITEGFGDALVIGDQQRPDLFALRIERPAPLYDAVEEVAERVGADGAVITPLDEAAVQRSARALVERGITTAAVALLHAWRNDAHEREVEAILRGGGFEHVSTSAGRAALIRFLPRATAALVDAYLGPVVASYLRGVAEHLGGAPLHVMTSAGGLVRSDAYAASESLLSGPAAGVTGAAAVGRAAGESRVIGFDMGGTSTDVARYDGDYEYRFEHSVGGVTVTAPALAIETVAAGGGSICAYRAGRLHVGPASAGADPGPACYGAGGPLTLTDVNLLLGRLDPEKFEIPLRPEAARARLDELHAVVAADAPDLEPTALLEGFLEIADERTADAIRAVSLRRGFDPADHALVAFGGAGGQHGCAVAERLGIGTVLLPRAASVLSAAGLEEALIERFAQGQVLAPLDEAAAELPARFAALAEEATAAVAAEDAGPVLVRRRLAELRLLGQEATITVDVSGDDGALRREALLEAFACHYEQQYGHAPSGKPVEIASLRVVASAAPPPGAAPPAPAPAPYEPAPARTQRARLGGAWGDARVFERGDLRAGARIDGPALVFDRSSTVVLPAGWSAALDEQGTLTARRTAGRGADPARAALVRQELYTGRLDAIAREMGQVLQRAALSTNVKERLDFSCALLDADGNLVVNAPHMPVHLGSLGLCVRSVASTMDLRRGDVVVTNHPAHGGSHLPDITVITPIHDGDGRLLAYAANRAHHAEVGGTRPGSMPPDATCLADEGVVLEPMIVQRAGRDDLDAVERRLRGDRHPTRAPADNMADLRAQVAANRLAVEAVGRLAGQVGAGALREAMHEITERAARAAGRAIGALGDGTYKATEHLDDGAPLHVNIAVAGEEATFDFTRSAPVHPRNLNATPAIVRGAVIYVLRLIVGQRLPLNEGMMRHVRIVLPEGLLNPPFHQDPRRCPAVVGGNVETSQRLVDTLLKALGVCACSQGTMNNVLFGDDTFGYYETVCGGSGAGPGFAGLDAVHTHMTNTRITDVEVLEHRYPVVLERFAIRRGSGGRGRYRGGDGVVRQYLFTRPCALSLLTQHRSAGPYGAAGGAAGLPGAQHLLRADGGREDLAWADARDVRAGDRLVLLTPGGGGWGAR